MPSKRTLRHNKPGYITATGIIRNLYLISDVKAIAISLTRDGLGLKTSLELDERKKTLVGSMKTIDIDYIKKNPVPNPVELKKYMIKDADISIITTIDRKISLAVGVNYVAAAQTGVEVLANLRTLLESCKHVSPVLKPRHSQVNQF